MKWGIVFGMTALAVVLVWYEWPKMKHLPKKDKLAFLALVSLTWFLSLFDLPNIPGPTTIAQAVFKPFEIIFK